MVDGSSGELDVQQPDVLSVGHSAVYTATPKSPTLRRSRQEHAGGPGFPEEFGHISFVTLPQLRQIATGLRLVPKHEF